VRRIADPARLPGLDLLRAVAIAWVMATHANGFGLLPVDLFGWMGVDLFFVLSGFLIGSQLFRPLARSEAPDYPNFFVRRLLRTLPAYLVVVAVYAAFPALWDRKQLQPLWQFLSFTQNLFIDPGQSNSLSQAWSLCVEEQFYLLLPAAMLLFGARASWKAIVTAIVAILVLGMGLRGYLWLHHVARPAMSLAGEPDPRRYLRYIYYPTWTRLDGLLAGVSLALVRCFRPQAWARLASRPNLLLASGVLGVLASMALFGDQIAGFAGTVFGFPLLAFSLAALVAGGSQATSLIGRYAVPGAGGLAAASYSIYLTHKLAYRAVINLSAHAPAGLKDLTPALAIGAALTLGAALYWLVERPFLKLRERFRRTMPALVPSLTPVVEPTAVPAD
jgi:peptidoglycan/LPS O-acetylase OafA/YrhL